MRYVGSKMSTLGAVAKFVLDRVDGGTFCDPFGGVGCVGSYFKQRGFAVHSGDILAIAHAFQTARVVLDAVPAFPSLRSVGVVGAAEVFAALNGVRPVSGWITNDFAIKRQYFTIENARLADGARRKIAGWNRAGLLTAQEHAYLLACLIDAIDRVANTAGTYYAYLKEFTRRATHPIAITPIPPALGTSGCTATLTDANDLVGMRRYTVLYLDPPYNSRDYAGYYHLPETIARERRPRPVGISGVSAADRPRSKFYRPTTAGQALADLLDIARFDLLVVQYADSGVIRPNILASILARHGDVTRHDVRAIGYTTRSTSRSSSHALYLVEP